MVTPNAIEGAEPVWPLYVIRTARRDELHLLDGAPPEIANELREKLNKWTARRWTIALSRRPGALPLGEQKRAEEAAEIEALKQHPSVRAVLDQFPDAEIASVKPIAAPAAEESNDEPGEDSAVG